MGGGGAGPRQNVSTDPLSRAVHPAAPEEFNVQTCLTHIWVIAVLFDCLVFLRIQVLRAHRQVDMQERPCLGGF